MKFTELPHSYYIGETNKIIDFTVIRLEKLIKEFSELQLYETVEDIKKVLEEYNKGNANIRWRNGLPYVKYLNAEKDKQ